MRKPGAIEAIDRLPGSGWTSQDDTSEWSADDLRYQWVGTEKGTLVLCRTITIAHPNGQPPSVVMSYWDDDFNGWLAIPGLQQLEGSSVSASDELVIAQLEQGNVYRLYPGIDAERDAWEPGDITPEQVVLSGALRGFWRVPPDPPATSFRYVDEPWAA